MYSYSYSKYTPLESKIKGHFDRTKNMQPMNYIMNQIRDKVDKITSLCSPFIKK